MQKRTLLIATACPETAARLLTSNAGASTMCLHARSAAEALHLLRAMFVDVLVLDRSLRGADEVAAHVHERHLRPVRLVVFGGGSDAELGAGVS
jgi:hypothetical protein